MDNNNLKFVAQPVGFLKYKMLHPNPIWGLETHHADTRDLATGIHSFDILSPDDTTANPSHVNTGMYQLKFYDRGAQHLHHAKVGGGDGVGFGKTFSASGRTDSIFDSWLIMDRVTKRRSSNEAPIQAYWLPYKMNRTFEMDLGTDANIFFTAGLSGCSVVVGGNPQTPHVAHINRMDGAELERIFAPMFPMRFEEVLEQQRAKATGGAFYATTPKPTKAETTTRQILMQEIKAAGGSPARANNLRGDNFAPRTTGPVTVGGARPIGNHIFGVLDFELHYKGASAYDLTANIVGCRNTATGNWHFVYQMFGSTGTTYYMRDHLRCLICRQRTDFCTCPP